MSGMQHSKSSLASSIIACADCIYAVPGYPVSDLVSQTQAMLVINEKVALEFAIGDSLAGRRACVIVKHVGMNALIDPLVHATFQGIRAGVVIVCGDDPVARNTMTVQDSRYFGPVAGIPVFENADASGIDDAFAASETYSRVALVRLIPEQLPSGEAEKSVHTETGICRSGKPGALADSDLTMYGRAVWVAGGTDHLISAGLAPLPYPALTASSAPVNRKDRGFVLSLCGECPFRSLFELMQNSDISVISDTGCSLIAMNPPFSFGIASYGMGSAVAVAAQAGRVALIGDYALLHSGLQSLIEVYRHKIPLLTVVMVNQCMGMTGGQPTEDPLPYLGFASPEMCEASHSKRLEQLLSYHDLPRTVLVYGRCPEVINHETVAC